jgi:hypothetical protein
MVGIVGDRQTGIETNLAEWCAGGTDPAIRKFAFGNRNTGGSLGVGVGRRTTSSILRQGRHLTLMF